MAQNPEEWTEFTKPVIGNTVYVYTEDTNGTITAQVEDDYQILLDNGTEITATVDDFTLVQNDILPTWSTMWLFGESVDENWLAGKKPTLSADDSAQPHISIFHSNRCLYSRYWFPTKLKPARKRKKDETPVTEPIGVIVAKHLKAGRDYDCLPTKSKPTLFKSGAEILCGVFGFGTTAQVIRRIEDYDKQFILYEVQVTAYGKDDKSIAEGIGARNSKERKYMRGVYGYPT